MSPRPALAILVASLLVAAACNSADAPPEPSGFDIPALRTRADSLVHDAIAAAGQWALDTATVSFRFRDGVYGVDRRDGQYVYTRTFRDSVGQEIDDVLTNDGFQRRAANRAVSLAPKADASARAALNSVVYFAFLPRWLADAGAVRTYDGLDTLRGTAYHRLRVTFREAGGGVDFQDEFLYWFDVDDLSLDYLAYSYATDGGGVRFREAFNVREVGGVSVRDYRNYRPGPSESVGLGEIAEAWDVGDLELLSTVALEEVRVVR